MGDLANVAVVNWEAFRLVVYAMLMARFDTTIFQIQERGGVL